MMSNFKKGERHEFFDIFNSLLESIRNEKYRGDDLKMRTNLEVYFLIYEIHPKGLNKDQISSGKM